MSLEYSKIFVAGHRGMVGSSIVRALERHSTCEVITATSKELDLRDQSAVHAWFQEFRPDAVVLAAAKVGGIYANNAYPAEFIYDNLMIAANVVHAAWKAEARRLLFLGSSCIYPKMAPQPMPESCLLESYLEPTNEAYALAKIAGLKLCQHYRKQYGALFHSAMPTNLYGPGDNYHPENSHVIPGMIRRFHEAKVEQRTSVAIWGTGTPLREFLHVDDLSSACLHLLGMTDPPNWVNVGSGEEKSILELAHLVKEVVGFKGKVVLDESKPDGTPRKLLDCDLIHRTGWKPQIALEAGLQQAYAAFLTTCE